MTTVLCPVCRRKLRLRTTKALQKLKEQGVKLGSNHPAVRKALKTFRRKQRAEIALRNKQEKEKEKKRANLVLSIIKNLRRQGATVKEITFKLNKRKLTTKNGFKFHPTTVNRLMQK